MSRNNGDTLEIAATRVRIWGIDAPEHCQTCRIAGQLWRCGDEASKAMKELVHSQSVVCDDRGQDCYERLVAVCSVGDVDLGAAMVTGGWALDYARYSKGAYGQV